MLEPKAEINCAGKVSSHKNKKAPNITNQIVFHYSNPKSVQQNHWKSHRNKSQFLCKIASMKTIGKSIKCRNHLNSWLE